MGRARREGVGWPLINSSQRGGNSRVCFSPESSENVSRHDRQKWASKWTVTCCWIHRSGFPETLAHQTHIPASP